MNSILNQNSFINYIYIIIFLEIFYSKMINKYLINKNYLYIILIKLQKLIILTLEIIDYFK